MASWHAAEGVRLRDRAIVAVPALAPNATAFRGEPVAGNLSVLAACPPCGARLPRFLGQLRRRQFRPVADALAEAWDRRHRVIWHDDCEPLPDLPEADKRDWQKKKPDCNDACTCLCKEDGDGVWKLGVFLISAVVKTFPKGSRAPANNSDIAVRLMGEVVSKVRDDAGVESEARATSVDTFFYLPLTHWSPYTPIFRMMQWPDRYIDDLGLIHLLAEHKYRNVWQVAREVYLEQCNVWHARCYELADSDAPLRRLDPLHVEVQEVVHYQWHIYDKRPKQRKPREKKDPAHVWADCLRDLGSGESDASRTSSAPSSRRSPRGIQFLIVKCRKL